MCTVSIYISYSYNNKYMRHSLHTNDGLCTVYIKHRLTSTVATTRDSIYQLTTPVNQRGVADIHLSTSPFRSVYIFIHHHQYSIISNVPISFFLSDRYESDSRLFSDIFDLVPTKSLDLFSDNDRRFTIGER